MKNIEVADEVSTDISSAGADTTERRLRGRDKPRRKAKRKGKAKVNDATDGKVEKRKLARKERKRAPPHKGKHSIVKQDQRQESQSAEDVAARKERKTARRAARKLKKGLPPAQSLTADEQPPVSKDSRSPASVVPAQRRRRKRLKDRGAERDESAADLSEDALAEENEEEDLDTAGRRRRGRLANPLATTVVADSGPLTRRLFAHLHKQFGDIGIELIPATHDADLVVSLSSSEAASADRTEKAIVVFVGERTSEATGDATLAKLAMDRQGLFVSTAPLSRRLRKEDLLGADGHFTDDTLILIAADVRDLVFIEKRDSLAAPALARPQVRDLSEALSLSVSATGMLQALSWPASSPPVSIRAAMDVHSIEAFLEGKVGVRDGKTTRMLTLPLQEKLELESKSANYAVYGLDFLSSVLGYWFQKANKASSKRISQIDALVKERGATASTLLTRAGDTLAEFLEKSDALPESAWALQVAMRRARAMELYLLCCRAAAQRRIKFDERNSTPVFHALVNILDRLRPAATSALGTAQGVARAAHVAGLAMPLRQTSFGANLLKDALDAVEIQLELGLFPDGVWREGFPQHASVLEIVRNLSTDLRRAGISSVGFSGLMTKMAEFVREYLRDDAFSPPLAGLPPAKYRSALAAAHSVLRSVRSGASATAGNSMRGASLFPQAGIFTSRSPASKGKASSHFVLQIAPPRSGGPSLSFSGGASQLLIGGGTNNRKAPAEVRRTNSKEPGAHNAIRVNGLSYKVAQELPAPFVVERIWDEKNWAAVRMINRAFPPVIMARTAVHLKPLHALLIVDELFANGDPAKFEQFWHLAPGLEVREQAPHRLFFALPEDSDGGVSVLFDGMTPSVLVTAGSDSIGWTSTGKREVARNPYLVRSLLAKKSVIGAFFRSTRKPTGHTLTISPAGQGWNAVLSGEGGQIGFVSENGQLKPGS